MPSVVQGPDKAPPELLPELGTDVPDEGAGAGAGAGPGAEGATGAAEATTDGAALALGTKTPPVLVGWVVEAEDETPAAEDEPPLAELPLEPPLDVDPPAQVPVGPFNIPPAYCREVPGSGNWRSTES